MGRDLRKWYAKMGVMLAIGGVGAGVYWNTSQVVFAEEMEDELISVEEYKRMVGEREQELTNWINKYQDFVTDKKIVENARIDLKIAVDRALHNYSSDSLRRKTVEYNIMRLGNDLFYNFQKAVMATISDKKLQIRIREVNENIFYMKDEKEQVIQRLTSIIKYYGLNNGPLRDESEMGNRITELLEENFPKNFDEGIELFNAKEYLPIYAPTEKNIREIKNASLMEKRKLALRKSCLMTKK